MSQLRILITGSRQWRDELIVSAAIGQALSIYTTIGNPVLVHGGAQGADMLADHVWRQLRCEIRGLDPAEVYPAGDFPSPRARNQHMVDLGATVCLAFATSWASGTGMCARMARRAGIHTIDYGVSTDVRADVTR